MKYMKVVFFCLILCVIAPGCRITGQSNNGHQLRLIAQERVGITESITFYATVDMKELVVPEGAVENGLTWEMETQDGSWKIKKSLEGYVLPMHPVSYRKGQVIPISKDVSTFFESPKTGQAYRVFLDAPVPGGRLTSNTIRVIVK